jgi:neutral trehalase
MCYNARTLGQVHAKLSEKGKDDPDAKKYFALSKNIAKNIAKLMYDKSTGSWFDYDFVNEVQSLSSFTSVTPITKTHNILTSLNQNP